MKSLNFARCCSCSHPTLWAFPSGNLPRDCRVMAKPTSLQYLMSPPECTKIAHRRSLAIFFRRRGYRKEFRSENHFYPFSSQKKSRLASDFLRRGNCASWGLEKSRDCLGSGKNRRRSRRESRDFGALRSPHRRSISLGLILRARGVAVVW